MKDLTHKMAQFFCGEDFAEHGEDARLELTPSDLRKITYLMHENARLKSATEAMLKKLKCEIQEMQKIDTCDYSCTWCVDRDDILTIIQEKINALKEREDGTENAD